MGFGVRWLNLNPSFQASCALPLETNKNNQVMRHISLIINCMYFQILLSRNVKPSLQQLLLCDNFSSFTNILCDNSFSQQYALRQFFFCDKYPLRQLSQQIFFAKILFYKNNSLRKKYWVAEKVRSFFK